MKTINELRNQRAKTWNAAKAFLDDHRNEKGILYEEDAKTYEAMLKEFVNLGHEIDRQERMNAMELEMAASGFSSKQKAVLRLAFKLLDTLVYTADTVKFGNEYIDASSVFEVREKLEKVFRTDLE